MEGLLLNVRRVRCKPHPYPDGTRCASYVHLFVTKQGRPVWWSWPDRPCGSRLIPLPHALGLWLQRRGWVGSP